MDEPKYFIAGDTVEWEKSLSDYPATEWTLTYYFWNESHDFSVVATSDNNDYLAQITAAVSAEIDSGTYNWRAVVSQGSGESLERHTVANGSMEVWHNPASGEGAGFDSRSAVKIALDNIDAVLANRATKDQQEYSIAGRSLARTPIPDLIVLRAHYARLYAQEVKNKKIAQGLGYKRIYTRFK